MLLILLFVIFVALQFCHEQLSPLPIIIYICTILLRMLPKSAFYIFSNLIKYSIMSMLNIFKFKYIGKIIFNIYKEYNLIKTEK